MWSLKVSGMRILVLVAACVMGPMACAVHAHTYYVATTGNDASAGTKARPWRTIQHAANMVQAGDTVYARAGIYNEAVNIPASGTAAGGYITFSSYLGELATLDGTGLTVPDGQYGLFTIDSQSYIVINGFEIRNYSTAAKSVPLGIWIFGAGSNVHITNNHIHDIVTTAKGCKGNAFGLTVYGTEAPAAIENLIITGNEVDHLTTGCSESLSVDGNVENFQITNNLVHDNNNIGIDAIGFEGVSPDPAYDQARNGLISGNTIYNITSYGNPAYGNQYAADGIYVDGGTQIVVERNLIHNVDLGIEMASEHSGHTSSYIIARNNLVYSDNSNGISIGGYANKVGGTENCTIVNNTLFHNDTKKTGSGEFQIQFHATENVFENNILFATEQALLVNSFTKSTPDPATLDYNLYFSPVAASKATWNWVGKTYTGYSAYLAETGNDTHSPPYSNPKFVDQGILNFDIKGASPAENAGANLGAAAVGTLDFAGNPRVENGLINIGAYEK